MAFSDDVIKQAWERAGDQCECIKRTHSHFRTPCGKQLVWKNRGGTGPGGWEAHHIHLSQGDILSNCEVICSACNESVE